MRGHVGAIERTDVLAGGAAATACALVNIWDIWRRGMASKRCSIAVVAALYGAWPAPASSGGKMRVRLERGDITPVFFARKGALNSDLAHQGIFTPEELKTLTFVAEAAIEVLGITRQYDVERIAKAAFFTYCKCETDSELSLKEILFRFGARTKDDLVRRPGRPEHFPGEAVRIRHATSRLN
jgi:hypothetical protein